MRIIKESRVKEYVRAFPVARASLDRWVRLTRRALWTNFADVRGTFPRADAVTVASGNKTVVFDIHGNDFRLIAAVHFAVEETENSRKTGRWVGGRVYVFYLLSHAQYDRDQWKEIL